MNLEIQATMLSVLGIITILYCPMLGMIGGLIGAGYVLKQQDEASMFAQSFFLDAMIVFCMCLLLSFCSCGMWAYHMTMYFQSHR